MEGEIDTAAFHRLIHLTRHKDGPEFAGMSHYDLHDYLESLTNPDEGHEAALFVAHRNTSLGRAVAMAEVRVEDTVDERTAALTELVIVPGTEQAQRIGELLVERVVSWSQEHDIDTVFVGASLFKDGQVAELLPNIQSNQLDRQPELVLV